MGRKCGIDVSPAGIAGLGVITLGMLKIAKAADWQPY